MRTIQARHLRVNEQPFKKSVTQEGSLIADGTKVISFVTEIVELEHLS